MVTTNIFLGNQEKKRCDVRLDDLVPHGGIGGKYSVDLDVEISCWEECPGELPRRRKKVVKI